MAGCEDDDTPYVRQTYFYFAEHLVLLHHARASVQSIFESGIFYSMYSMNSQCPLESLSQKFNSGVA